MYYPLPLFIGSRYARARSGNGFVAFIHFFSTAGITIGVAALIIVSSVMNGFEYQLKQRILGLVPHVRIQAPAQDYLPASQWQPLLASAQNQSGQDPQWLGTAPDLSTAAMIQSPLKMNGVQLVGSWPEYDAQLAPWASTTMAPLQSLLQPGKYGVVLSFALASQMGVDVGDKVRLLVTEGARFTPLGRVPNQRRFTVTGFYELGSQADLSYVYVHGHDLARLIGQGKGNVQGLRVYLQDAFLAQSKMTELQNQFPQMQLSDWRADFGELFDAVSMEKAMMSLLLGLIIAVATFNIVSALVMIVGEKRSDIAILKTLGLSPRRIATIFTIQGMSHGVFGAILGGAAGITITYHLNQIATALGLPVATIPGGEGLPVAMQTQQIVLTLIAAILMSLLATLYPAWRASKIQPAEALRYE